MTSQQQVCSASSENEGQVLGRRLREVRKYIGFKQQQVATHLGIPRTAISEMESGKRNVSVLELKKLARLYQFINTRWSISRRMRYRISPMLCSQSILHL